jgi:hypothetical protein
VSSYFSVLLICVDWHTKCATAVRSLVCTTWTKFIGDVLLKRFAPLYGKWFLRPFCSQLVGESRVECWITWQADGYFCVRTGTGNHSVKPRDITVFHGDRTYVLHHKKPLLLLFDFHGETVSFINIIIHFRARKILKKYIYMRVQNFIL